MHDAVNLEQVGIPAAVIVEDLFEKAANTKLRMMGMREFEPIVVPHPLGVATEAKHKGQGVVEQVISWLTTGKLSA